MTRPLRIDLAGGWYHVTARGIERRAIYRDARDRTHFLALIEEAVVRYGIVVHGFVLMDNHYHLVVETPAANLSAAMQWVNVSYSVWFNRRRGRVGHVFQGRFQAVVVEPGAYAVELSRYVHLNPVRVKGLGLDKATQERARVGMGRASSPEVVRERVRRLRGYRWSSYRAYIGLVKAPAWLVTGSVLAMMGRGTKRKGRESYREYVESAVREGMAASPWERMAAGLVLGGREFVDRMRQRAKGDARQQPSLRALQKRCELSEIVAQVERLKGQPWGRFRDEHGDWGRDMVLWLARKVAGVKLRELADLVGVTTEATVAMAVRRMNERMKREPALRKQMETAQRQLLNVKT